MSQLLTIAEISRQLSIPESTLRYRAKLFKDFLPTEGSGRKRRFTEICLERFGFIDELFNKGLVADDVRIKLESKYEKEIEAEITESSKKKKNVQTKNVQSNTREISTPGMTFEIQELLVPMIKVIEKQDEVIANQEIIITELKKQNKILAMLPEQSKKKSWLAKVFG